MRRENIPKKADGGYFLVMFGLKRKGVASKQEQRMHV